MKAHPRAPLKQEWNTFIPLTQLLSCSSVPNSEGPPTSPLEQERNTFAPLTYLLPCEGPSSLVICTSPRDPPSRRGISSIRSVVAMKLRLELWKPPLEPPSSRRGTPLFRSHSRHAAPSQIVKPPSRGPSSRRGLPFFRSRSCFHAVLSRRLQFTGNLHIGRFVSAEFAAVFDHTGGICWGPPRLAPFEIIISVIIRWFVWRYE